MKAVNMKNYKFGDKVKWYYVKGFGMYDEATNSFASMDGKTPYILDTKKLMEACIAADFESICKYRIKAN